MCVLRYRPETPKNRYIPKASLYYSINTEQPNLSGGVLLRHITKL